MSDNPIERLIAAGHTEILEAAGWECETHRKANGGILEAHEATEDHIDIAGMAAFEWLAKGDHLLTAPAYSSKVDKFLILLRGPQPFTAPTLAEAAIDAAIAVWEASRGN
jgi:hypothetical protein